MSKIFWCNIYYICFIWSVLIRFWLSWAPDTAFLHSPSSLRLHRNLHSGFIPIPFRDLRSIWKRTVFARTRWVEIHASSVPAVFTETDLCSVPGISPWTVYWLAYRLARRRSFLRRRRGDYTQTKGRVQQTLNKIAELKLMARQEWDENSQRILDLRFGHFFPSILLFCWLSGRFIP